MNAHARRGVECVVLLFLTGGLAHIDRAKAVGGGGGDGQQLAAWSTAYQSQVGSQSTSIAATVRSFQSTHPDFRLAASGVQPGRYQGIMASALGADGKPVFASTGNRVLTDWRDAAGKAIIKPRSYISAQSGDTAGALDPATGAAVSSASTFNQWFRDTPGVNSTTKSTLALTKQGSSYVFDGSLDNLTGSTNTDYTAEASWYFVNEANRNFFIDVASNAEVWVYVDDKLVIDGGGIGGVKFDITNNTVVTQEPCDAAITVVGAAIQSGSTPCPVTVRAKVGATTKDPFGSFTSWSAGNVNTTTGNPRTASLGSSLPSGTVISVAGQSWLPSGSSASSYLTIDSSTTSPNVRAFRNGDSAPDIKPFQNQAAAATFLAPYIDAATKRVKLQTNQIIYLFELGTTNLSSTAADFQDLVVLVTLNRPAVTQTTSTTTTTFSAAPDMQQRIDLSRLPWLDDLSSHKITVLFANRTGASSNLRLETNISTLNLANFRTAVEQD